MSIYLDVIKVLEERGWYQGDSEGPDGSVCIVRAMFLAGVAGRCFLDARDWISELANGLCLPAFNDDPHTTYEDVVLLLKRAHEASESA